MLPPGFRFGTSTASSQIEGAAGEDGRGPSIWDTFSAEPGRIVDGSTGEVACDHYHRVDEDVALMQELGTGGYRFSLAWPRIQPTGRGPANEKGLAFYDRLIDTLLEHGQQPMVTLYHWDLPQALEDDGGWLNRDTVDRFADYARIVGERYADRVEHWIPGNEPSVVAIQGYGMGVHAPGKKLLFDCLPVAHHLLLAHGRAAIELRRAGATSIGCANNHAPIWPASDDDADVGMSKIFDALWNGMFLEPMLLGRYPADLMPILEDVIHDGDLATIRQPLDFYGVNYYRTHSFAGSGEDSELHSDSTQRAAYLTIESGCPVVPDALREWLVMFRARFRAALPPIYITESGCSYGTGPDEHGVVDDQARIDYLRSHIGAVSEAVTRGVDVRGYYCWSLMDNVEWAEGYTQRYGLVHIDYETLKRTRKNSFHWYADLIAAQPQHL
jgi:beta-glucosidase